LTENSDTKNDGSNSESSQTSKKTKIGRWILFIFLVAIYSAIYFVVINLQQFPKLKALNIWIKLLGYVFIMLIFFGPFIPIRRKGGKRVSIVNSLVRMIEGPKRRRYGPKPQSKLNVKYKPPLISSCKKCGFLLTRQMQKCPNCHTENPYYTPI
jgi:hypothetical protein